MAHERDTGEMQEVTDAAILALARKQREPFDRLTFLGTAGNHIQRCRWLLVALIWTITLFGAARAVVAERIAIVHGADAPPLERRAAAELKSQFEELFTEVVTSVTTSLDGNYDYVILIGGPDTNRYTADSIDSAWPELSDQGLVIQRCKLAEQSGLTLGPGLILGGGSPVATLWAVYELGEQYGIRYSLRHDIFPPEKVSFRLPERDLVLEPRLRRRTWRTVNDFAIGPESWGIDDHRQVLGQLAKLKFNHVMIAVWPWQPFVDYEFGGVKKTTATFWFDEKYRVDGETPGKKVFSGAAFFENPDFAGLSTYDDLVAAGRQHIRGIIAAAHELGMGTGILLAPLQFTKEFQSVLPGSHVAHQLKGLTITPSAEQHPRDPTLTALVRRKLQAYVESYPTMDTFYLSMSEFPEWNQHAEQAWEQLASGTSAGGTTLDELVESVSNRGITAADERGRSALRGNVVALAFLQGLLEDRRFLQRPDGREVDIIVSNLDPALYPYMEDVLPAKAATLHFVDYTARRIVENQQLLDAVPAERIPSQLIMTLADDNVGVLPQTALQDIGRLTNQLLERGWEGFSTRYWMLAEQDPVVYYLSRAAWDPKLTARLAHDQFWKGPAGSDAGVERMRIGFTHLEAATKLIDERQIGFGFPVQGMMMEHYRPDPIPDWWQEVTDHYEQWMIECYRVHGSATPGGQRLLFYYAKRAGFALEYLAAVKAVREAAIAREQGESDKAIEQLETAVEQTYNAMTTLADVARDQGDRGLIAILNAYAYRPVVAEYERLLDSTE